MGGDQGRTGASPPGRVGQGCIAVSPGSTGAQLRAARDELGWSRADLARQLREVAPKVPGRELPHVDSLVDMIKQWEGGRHAPNARYRALLALALEMDQAELFGREPAAEARGAAVPRLNGRPADATAVDTLRETSQMLVRLETLHGGNEILPLALRIFRDTHHRLAAGQYEPVIERDLVAATGELGEVAAWLAYDVDRQAASRQLIHEALMLSRQAGDRSMELFELSHLAMQSLYLRRPAEAHRIVGEVLDGGGVAPRVTALFDIRRGRALALMGEEHRAMAALDKAAAALGESISPRDPHWTWWVNQIELTRHRGTARAQLDQWDQAVPLYEQVVAEGLPGFLDRTQLLEAVVRVRDWRRAEDLITEVAGLAGLIGSARTTNLLRRVAEQIGRADAPSTVADAAAELRRTLDEPPAEDLITGLR